jgi:hypothetical protein
MAPGQIGQQMMICVAWNRVLHGNLPGTFGDGL